MAAVVPPADQAADLLKNLSLDSQTKTTEITEPTKKASVNSRNGQVQPSNRSVTPLILDYMDPTVGYYPNAYASNAYYYGGYDGSTIDWDEYSKYMNAEGIDLSHGLYGYGYAPYSPAGSPAPTVGQDGQFYGAQHYQYLNSYYQPLTSSGGPYPAGANSKGGTTTPAAADKSALSVDTTKGTSNVAKGNTGSALVKPTAYQNSGYGSYGRGAQNSYQDPRYGFDGVHSPVPWLDRSMYSDPKTRNNGNNTTGSYGNSIASRNFMIPRPMTGLNTASGYLNGMYPNKLYGHYGSTYRSGYGSNAGWLTVDNKYKPRGRGNSFFGYNNENSDGLNELNRGPRATTIKNQKLFASIALAVKGQNVTLPSTETIENEVKDVKELKEVSLTLDREQYNKSDFPETYADAKFFIIKSYSEDDVHKSIKYNVWASTQNGNKKLDAAYQEAQQKSKPCPVFLFFSVNASGQFVGVAEMVGPVDFDKSLEYWQQDKWIGCFHVKWHFIKDVPNSLLKHIILEFNENKPVTNSRDTQEVKFEQGLQMVKIFKEHSSKQCILDDFVFYEDRQKKIQEKKAKQLQFQKQAWEGKPAIDENIKQGIKVEVPKSADVTDSLNKVKIVGKDGVANGVAEKVTVNGEANGC